MSTLTQQNLETVQVYRVWIKSTPQAIWNAITTPEWTDRYGYGGLADYDLRPGGKFVMTAGSGMQAHGITGPICDGEVIESDPPRKLVQTWRLLMDDGIKAEGFTRLTYQIDEQPGGVSRLTVTHDVTGAPKLSVLVGGASEEQGAGGGWAWVLSDLKSLLETGSGFNG